MSITPKELESNLALGAVAVVGAGLSIAARYPGTSGLLSLLWDAVDSSEEASGAIASKFNMKVSPAKAMIGDDTEKVKFAWDSVISSQDAWLRFQSTFSALDEQRAGNPSRSHEALARLVHAGTIELVISFNWDSALERAYERLYGVSFPSGVLYKPHGDVAFKEERWVYPNEDGNVPDALLSRVDNLTRQYPRTLLIVGYSGSDELVVSKLLQPLGNKWHVSRISPNADGKYDVSGTADEVLESLVREVKVSEEDNAWQLVKFENQRSIVAALEGQRLTPRDVEACIRFSEADRILNSLQRGHSALITGSSGAGKSLTAYKVCQTLNERGYEVLRIREGARSAGINLWRTHLKSFPHPKVLLLDDAQGLPVDQVREFSELANEKCLILIVGIDSQIEGIRNHRISSVTSVAEIHKYVIDHRDEILKEVRHLDPRVGDRFEDDSYDRRLQIAAQQKTGWQYFYVLTGGWRRIKNEVIDLRDFDRADLLLFIVALLQIASVDNGGSTEQLRTLAEELPRDQAWVNKNLRLLQDRRLVIVEEGRWRCAHLMTALRIVSAFFHPPRSYYAPRNVEGRVPPIKSAETFKSDPRMDDEVRQSPMEMQILSDEDIRDDRILAARFVTLVTDNPQTPLRGIAWLLGEPDFELRETFRTTQVLNIDRERFLAERALGAKKPDDISQAAQLLERVILRPQGSVKTLVWEEIDVIISWIETATPENSYSLSSLVNSLSNLHKESFEEHLRSIDVPRLVELIYRGGWENIYGTMRLVDRVCYAGGIPLLRQALDAFDTARLNAMFQQNFELPAADALLGGLAMLSPQTGIDVFEANVERIAGLFSRDILDGYNSMHSTFMMLLGYPSLFFKGEKPPKEAKRLSEKFISSVDKDQLSLLISNPVDDRRWFNFPIFLEMYKSVNPLGWSEICSNIDFQSLEIALDFQLPKLSKELTHLLYLIKGEKSEEVDDLLMSRRGQFSSLTLELAFVAPELACHLLRRGLPLDLALQSHQFEIAAAIVEEINEIDSQVALELIEANQESLIVAMGARVQPPFTGLNTWLETAERLKPGFTKSLLSELPKGTTSSWDEALRRPASKKEIGPIIIKAIYSSSPISKEAKDLVRRFPSLHKLK